MDLNELKKLINEEVKRTRQKNLLKEQGQRTVTGKTIGGKGTADDRRPTQIVPGIAGQQGVEEPTKSGLFPQDIKHFESPEQQQKEFLNIKTDAEFLIKKLNQQESPTAFSILSNIVTSKDLEDLRKKQFPTDIRIQPSSDSDKYAHEVKAFGLLSKVQKLKKYLPIPQKQNVSNPVSATAPTVIKPTPQPPKPLKTGIFTSLFTENKNK